jgi:hypothetical protein
MLLATNTIRLGAELEEGGIGVEVEDVSRHASAVILRRKAPGDLL